jgi:hypothetical protein
MLIGKMPNTDSSGWLDKTAIGAVGVLTLDDGKQLHVELIDVSEGLDELIVHVIPPNRFHAGAAQEKRSIPFSHVVDFENQPQETQPWPYSDPCRNSSFSLVRFVLMSIIFLGLTVGTVLLPLLPVHKSPYRLQELSTISYTFYVVFFTFAATRQWRRYLFTCPAVQPELPRLLWRHLCFLVALFVLQTKALAIRLDLPAWWRTESSKGSTPFEGTLLLLCIVLALVQVFTNRSLLERAHKVFSVKAAR